MQVDPTQLRNLAQELLEQNAETGSATGSGDTSSDAATATIPVPAPDDTKQTSASLASSVLKRLSAEAVADLPGSDDLPSADDALSQVEAAALADPASLLGAQGAPNPAAARSLLS